MYNLKQNFCVRPYGIAKVVCQMENKLNPEKTEVIIFSRSPLARILEPILELYGERLKIYPQMKFLHIIFDSKLTFQKHFEEILGCCNIRVPLCKTYSQYKMGTQPVHRITSLQTMCLANFRIWLTFDHNNIGHNHQQNSMAPEQVYPSCPAFTKIHQCKATT